MQDLSLNNKGAPVPSAAPQGDRKQQTEVTITGRLICQRGRGSEVVYVLGSLLHTGTAPQWSSHRWGLTDGHA